MKLPHWDTQHWSVVLDVVFPVGSAAGQMKTDDLRRLRWIA